MVCDLDRFEIHTNFTGTIKQAYDFDLDRLAEPANLDVLRKVFHDPNALRPDRTTARITEEAAAQFTLLAEGLRLRGIDPEPAAHFLMKLIFCFFAEDIGLLRAGLFTDLLEKGVDDPQRLTRLMGTLFEAMCRGGDFGVETIAHFNGGLFADADVIELCPDEIRRLVAMSRHDWADVEPSIFGTLFERLLDPSKRSQIGAHYTSREDILTLVEPVLMAPLRHEWTEVQTKCEKLEAEAAKAKTAQTKRRKFTQRDRALQDFVERLAHVTVLDPACGSGNFLYVAIHLLLDLGKEVIAYAAAHGLSLLPQVRPTQLAGIEINPYAQELASVVIWIGYLQWMHHNGFSPPRDPVLEPIATIWLRDAILDLSDPENPKEPEWPAADVIVGNPPFLGDKVMRRGLGDEYVEALRKLYEDRIPGQSDLCCYWLERARTELEAKKCRRVGLLATQNVRGGASRTVLDRITNTGGIFFAVSDRNWILDGAMVHISMIGFDDRTEKNRILGGREVGIVHSNLTATFDGSRAQRLPENNSIGFLGSCKGGSFDVSDSEALDLLIVAGNPHGRPNSDVVRPVMNSRELLGRHNFRWIIDNGNLPLEQACLYDRPHVIVEERVKPHRDNNRDRWLRENWWRPQRMRAEMRSSVAPL